MIAAALLALAVQCPDGTPPPCTRPAATAPGANTVAVLLFANLTRDSTYDYLSDGIASEIATTMARVPRLDVRSPGAVRSAQRGAEADPRVLARRLNVRYLVEGDFQRGGDRIRISVRLVAAPSGSQRWSESYTRPAADLLAVQEEIARAVVAAIAGQLLPQDRSVLATRPTRNADAYDRFLRGNFHLARRTPSGVSRAIDEYTAAVGLDPTFAQAHARVALSYALYLDWGWDFPGVPRDTQIARGTRAADRALQLDSLSADGWMAHGYMSSFRHPKTLQGVLEGLQRSTALDPRNPEAWHQYGSWIMGSGQFEDAIVAYRRALALEPGRAVTYLQMGNTLEVLRRDAEAGRAYDSALAADPEFYAAYAFRTWIHLRAGDPGRARSDAEAALRHSPRGEEYYGYAPLAAVAAHGGDSVAARRLIAQATAPYSTVPPGALVAQMIAFGMIALDRETTIDWLSRAEPRGAVLFMTLAFPHFDSLRADPRFQSLVAESRPPQAR